MRTAAREIARGMFGSGRRLTLSVESARPAQRGLDAGDVWPLVRGRSRPARRRRPRSSRGCDADRLRLSAPRGGGGSHGRVEPGQLGGLGAAVAGDDPAAALRRGLRAQVADQDALVAAAREHHAGHREVAQRLDHRLVDAREAPPVRRATTTCRPTSRACAISGCSADTGEDCAVATRS